MSFPGKSFDTGNPTSGSIGPEVIAVDCHAGIAMTWECEQLFRSALSTSGQLCPEVMTLSPIDYYDAANSSRE